MKYRRLGKTDLHVSVVGLGTWQFGGEWGQQFTQADVDAILDKGHELGINLIDTAECYGDHLSEAFIGDYVSRRKREDWIIATKFGHQFHERFTRTDVFDAEGVIRQLDASLRALRTDYIDLYQFHSGPDAAFDNDELWTVLDKQVQAGKIRNLGTSIGKNNSLHQVEASSQVNSRTIQVVYNRIDRDPEQHVFPSCQAQDLGVLARVPLASGYLSGKYKPGAVFSETDVRHRHDQEATRRKLEEVEQIKQNEVPSGVDMAQWALAWCLKYPAVTTVIPGCKNPEQVILNARAVELVTEAHPQDVSVK